MASNRGRGVALVGVDMTTSCSRRARTTSPPPANNGYHRQSRTPNAAELCCLPMLFDKLCRYIAYGWGSVETQQIPAILEVGRSATCRPDHEVHARGTIPDVVFIIECRFIRTDLTSGTFRVVDLGYARVSTSRQDLDRQVDALQAVGIDPARIYLDKKSGSTVERPGLRAVTGYARAGDVIVVHTLDRLGRTVRDTLNLIHELTERGVGVRNLADPIKVDSANPSDPMAQLAVVLLALFAQMERTYMLERAAHARAVATAKGRRAGRPSVVNPNQLDYARRLRDEGETIAQIVTKTGITRTTLYRHLPPRPAEPVTAGVSATAQ